MTLADAARSRGLGQAAAAPGRPKVTLDNDGRGTAEFVAPKDATENDFAELLAKMFPEVPVDVLDVVEVRAWGNPEDPYKYVKARVAKRLDGGLLGRELLEKIPRRRNRQRPQVKDADRTLIVALADLQLGKAHEKGGGSEETLARIRSVIAQIPDRVAALKQMGRPISRIVLANMGDTCEGNTGHYSTQAFTTDLNGSDQFAAALDVYDDAADMCAGLVPEVICTVVNSNHDRPREGGKYLTDATDSRAFDLWRALARAYQKAPERYGHVTWHIPTDPLVSTLDLHGIGVAFCHGHEATKGGPLPVGKLWTWWDGQMAGRLPAGDCQVLIAAHYHHFYALAQQGRLLVGCPALDGGSQWLTNTSGTWSHPGLLTLDVGPDGWGDPHVIRPEL